MNDNTKQSSLLQRTSLFEHPGLDAIFFPKSVAVIGATESRGTVGRTLLWNLITSPFGGTVYPVNPKRSNVLGIKAYPSIAACPERVDLAVIITPAPSIPGIMKECVEAGVRGSIVISAGFKEIGPKGAELERQVLEEARKGGIRIIGPNCLGLMNTANGLNATFATTIAQKGKVGFLSQSGALCTAVLDWSLNENVGFSSFISIGSMLDIGWGDLIYFLGDDPQTESIVIYMETIGDARSFMSAAREVALSKPIIIIKPGRTEAAAKAAASHTGSLTGSDDVLDAAFRRCGVLRVDSISELFAVSDILAKQPRPKGPNLTIVTNAGGPGVLASDSVIMNGGKLAELSQQTIEALNEFLPAAWSHSNPIDVIGDASPERYSKAVEVAAKDPNTDALLIILTPQAMTDPTKTAEEVKKFADIGKPVLASWMGGADSEAGQQILSRNNIPCFDAPDTAARLFDYMWNYSENLKSLYETPILSAGGEETGVDAASARLVLEEVKADGRELLTEFESKKVLSSYKIPIVETVIAETREAAVAAAAKMGFPVVLKLHSETITHKTDVGGVQLNLKDADAVGAAFDKIRTSVEKLKGTHAPTGEANFLGVTVQQMINPSEGYEIIIGTNLDPQLGPVLLFGTGGQLVEVFKDRSLGLPPLNTTLARRMMERTKIYKALKGVRGRKPVDLVALEQLMVRFSQLVCDQPLIKEIDINPLLASADRIVALDARIVLVDPKDAHAQPSKLAIRPYPSKYVRTTDLKTGEHIAIRPIRPEDEPMIKKFHEALSEKTVLHRYLEPVGLVQRVAHERLARICFIDYDREIALVGIHKDTAGNAAIIAVGRVVKVPNTRAGRFHVIVVDAFQNKGMGKELLDDILQFARDEKLEKVFGQVLVDDERTLRLAEKYGFKKVLEEGNIATIELVL